MISRRNVILTSVSAAVLIMVIIALFMTVWRSDRTASSEIDRFSDRDILVPGMEYEIPSVEEEILAPRFRYYIDPQKPLDSDVVENLKPDIGAALRDAFSAAVEAELEELLFEE